MIHRLKLNLTASGEAGASTASETTTSRLFGQILAIHVDHGASGAVTTDFTVTASDPSRTIMAKADSAADAWFYPSVQRTDAAGAAISGAYMSVPLYGEKITAALAQADDAQTAAVTIFWDDLR